MLARLKSDTILLASLAIAVSSFFWGFYWFPLRLLESHGIEGIWPANVINLSVLLFLIPIAIYRWRKFAAAPRYLTIAGIVIGFAFVFYGTAVVITDVVRAILLFYLSPVWSTILGLLWLNEKLNIRRIGALVFGIIGLMVILKADQGIPLPERLGDWMALASGFLWSVGSVQIFGPPGQRHGTFEFSFALVAGAVAAGLFVAFLVPAAEIGILPARPVIVDALPIIIAAAILLMMPVIFLTIWGTRRLSPARVGILLMGEIVVGVTSAAILTDDPFGIHEMAGAILVIAAALLEVWPPRKNRISAPPIP